MVFVLNMFGRGKGQKEGDYREAVPLEEDSFEMLPDEDYFRMLEAQGQDPNLHSTAVFSMEEKDKAHLKWTANSIDKAKGILLQIGARKWVHFIPFNQVPKTSKLLEELMARAELNRHVWIPTLDLTELNLYRTYALQPDKVRELEHIPQRWEKLFGLGIASEKFRDEDMVDVACRSLSRSAACVNYYYPAMMSREHVDYVFLQTTEGSRVRLTLIKLVCRVGNGWDFMLSFNGPRDFLLEAGTYLKKYAGTKYLDPDLDEYSIFGSSSGGSSPQRMVQLGDEDDKKPVFSRETSPTNLPVSDPGKGHVKMSAEQLESLQDALATQQQEVQELKTTVGMVASWQKQNEEVKPDEPQPTPLSSPTLGPCSPAVTPSTEDLKAELVEKCKDSRNSPPREDYATYLTPPHESQPSVSTSSRAPRFAHATATSRNRSQAPTVHQHHRRVSTSQADPPVTQPSDSMYRRVISVDSGRQGLDGRPRQRQYTVHRDQSIYGGDGGQLKRRASGQVLREQSGRQLRPRGPAEKRK
ncbi:hypothetical protein BDV96DRAFT_137385 [Lophiotrema nucula]|uniref:Uncharacterized protein n=1 Tax=Lophiotrema nucula TaxID=690887 RepID=A0A6A5ZRM4_9PLEO|nr:hypothetical protein BDV96DRAFT_137385 [Lophiotrema nucula]